MLIAVSVLFALFGAPVFIVMAGVTQGAWLSHPDTDMQWIRFLALDVLDERFTGNAVMTTVPLFTLAGYLMAESGTPSRIVRASSALLGWMPGGLALVCIVSSAFFTTLSGGSAVTIVAIGALLHPALLERGYPKQYSLGLVMTGGSLGLLLPPSIPVIVYSFVARIDYVIAFKALLLPGLLILALLSIHAVIVARRSRIPRTRLDIREIGRALWLVKWEAGVPVLIVALFASGVAAIDEIAALTVAYVATLELFVYRDLKLRALPRIVANAIALSGAILLIMAMAIAMTNYIITEQIPERFFETVTAWGVTELWQFLIVLNASLYVQGMFMDGFSAILVAVPLLIPFAAAFGLSPFHLAAMFLLNLEIAYLSPPLGQNLFVTSFRFRTPMVRLYRVALPFIGVLGVALVVLMIFPGLSTALVQEDIARARREAEARGDIPRDAFRLMCVQEDPNDPKPCTAADKKRYKRTPDETDLDALFDIDS